MIEVWGRTTSSNVQVVMWAAAELELETKRHDFGGAFGGTKSDEYLAMNPNGLIPVMKDDNLIMYESSAILRYLAANYGDNDFWPKDPKARARPDIWAEWTKNTLCPILIYQVFWTLIRTPKAERDIAALKASIERLETLMAMAEAQLDKHEFIGGDQFSFADIIFGHTLYRYYTLDFERTKLPKLADYYERLQTRDAYKEHVMIDYSALKVE